MGRTLTFIIIAILIIAAAGAALFLGSTEVEGREDTEAHKNTLLAKNEGERAHAENAAAANDRTSVSNESSESKPDPVASQPAVDVSTSPLVFRGVVLDGKQKPVANAEVNALRVSGPGGTISTKTASGTDGRFVVGLPDRNGWEWRIEAKAPGFATSYLSQLPAWLADVDVGAIILYPSVAVRGKVTNRDGQPIANAKIFVMTVSPPVEENDEEEAGNRYNSAASTGADGVYSIAQLPFGKVTIGVQAAGYVDTVRPGVILGDGRPNTVDFTVAPEELLQGRVVDDQNSALSKAKVLATNGDARNAFWRRTIETDADGKFTVHGLDRNRRTLNLRITKTGYSAAWHNGTQLPPDEKYTLQKSAQITVKAERNGGGAAPKIRSIRFETRRGNNRWNGWGDIQKFQREIVEPSVWRVSTEMRGMLRAVVTAEDGTTGTSAEFDLPRGQAGQAAREINVTLEPGGSLSGKVVKSDGTPVAGVRVEAVNGKNNVSLKVITTKEDGAFAFESLAPGTTQLVLRSKEWVTQDAKAEVRSGEATANVEIIAFKPSRMTGKVSIGGAAPPEPVSLAFYKIQNYENYQQWIRVGMTSTGADATYLMSPVPSGRIAVVPKRAIDAEDGAIRNFENELEHPEYNEELQKTWPWIVDVPPEGERLLDLELQAPKVAYVKGVVTVNGEPRSGLDMWVYSERGGDWKSDSTDSEGKFKFKLSRSGEYFVQISGDGFGEQRKVNVSEGETRELNFDLISGGVDGSICDSSSQGIALRVRLEKQRDKNRTNNESGYYWYDAPELLTKSDGSYSFPEVAAGTYRVVVSDYSHKFATMASAAFTVGPKEKYSVPQIRVPLAAHLVVQVKGPDNKTVSGTVKVTAAPNSEPLAKAVNSWLGRGATKIQTLRPGPVIVKFIPNGPYTAEPQTVNLPANGSVTTITIEAKKKEGAGADAAANANNGLSNIGYFGANAEGASYSGEEIEWEGDYDWGSSIEWHGGDFDGGSVQILDSGGGFIINK